MFPNDNIPAQCQQIIVVKSDAFDSFKCTVQLFEKIEGVWEPSSEIIEAVAGKNGWTKDKKEGDGCSPTGIYSLGEVFGYAAVQPDWLKMDYIPANEKLFCVDDVGSELYNKIISSADYPSKPWKSAEDMLRKDDLYKWGVVVNYNTENTVAGLGSCIFIHVWRNAETGTNGCIAMEEGDLMRMMKLLDKEKNPAILMAIGIG